MLQWLNNLFKSESRAITYQNGMQTGIISSPSWTGIPVSEQNALGISSLWCGLKVICEAVGSLPPVLYQRSKLGRDEASNHPLYYLLHSEPNTECTRPVFWETIQLHALLYGNGFAEIERDNSGRPIAIWNVHPAHIQIGRDSVTGDLIYRVQNSATGGPPGSPGQQTTLQASDILHVPGLTPDGSVGYRLLTLARETLGFGLGAQRYGCSLFRNMGRPAGIIDVPANIKLNDDGRANLRRSFSQEHAQENVGSIAVMEQGLKFAPLSLATNEQIQYQELLTFFVYEVARLLNLTPTKIFAMDNATWANLETLNADFLTTTLRPWLEKWECECERKLLLPSEKGKYFIEFDTQQLLRVDQQTRYQCYAVASGNAAWMTVNEIRKGENLPPIDGGDVLPGSTPEPAPEPQQPDDEDTNEGDDTNA